MVDENFLEIKEFFRLINPPWNEIGVDDEDCFTIIDQFKGFNKFDITPLEFLEFAKNDLKNENKHGFVNSLSNSKRAIDCQVDRILAYFGISPKKWNLRNFPSKVEFLQENGIITPRIVKKVIKTRNYLEHEYKCPAKEQVEDAMDIATLFIEASNGKLNFLKSFLIYWKKGDIEVEFDPYEKNFKFDGYKNKSIKSLVTPENKKYYNALLKLTIRIKKTMYSKKLFNSC